MDDRNNIELKFSQYLEKYIKDNKINHAYLLETNYNERTSLIKVLVQKIMQTDDKEIYDYLLNNGDLIVLDANSENGIKTEDVENLKEKFKTLSVNGSKRIYIINGVEKLSDYVLNKLLKFIEEPEKDIYTILVTENKNNVIETIVSRCQSLRFFINEDRFIKYDQEYIDSLFEFIMNIEENKEKAIAFQNRYDIKKLSDRKYIQEFLNNLLYIYDDVIKYKATKEIEFFPLYSDKIDIISNNNDIEQIRKKVNAIYKCINNLKYNPNIKLLIDKLIIMMSGVEII